MSTFTWQITKPNIFDKELWSSDTNGSKQLKFRSLALFVLVWSYQCVMEVGEESLRIAVRFQHLQGFREQLEPEDSSHSHSITFFVLNILTWYSVADCGRHFFVTQTSIRATFDQAF
ncbi:hypothetical protein GHT06_021371 [Daphnia sinensis]|uniref:Uncharacterized protein n=1 Tax=Daphnia sinensis TaxID=1820382 RepID=A0AAD5KKA8_9CRUS|nr:hypothetical protein GHT06_021371 [Daphnia sinensis]